MREKVALIDIDDTVKATEEMADRMGIGDRYREAREDLSTGGVRELYRTVFTGMEASQARELIKETPLKEGAVSTLEQLKYNGHFRVGITRNPVAHVAELDIRRLGFDHTIFEYTPTVEEGQLVEPLRRNGRKEELARDFVARNEPREVLVLTDPHDEEFNDEMEDEGYEVRKVDKGLRDQKHSLMDRYVRTESHMDR